MQNSFLRRKENRTNLEWDIEVSSQIIINAFVIVSVVCISRKHHTGSGNCGKCTYDTLAEYVGLWAESDRDRDRLDAYDHEYLLYTGQCYSILAGYAPKDESENRISIHFCISPGDRISIEGFAQGMALDIIQSR